LTFKTTQGSEWTYIARAFKGQKIHFYMCDRDGTPFDRSVCHHATRFDEEDEIKSMDVMASIMMDPRLCMTCQKNMREFFPKSEESKYR